MQTLRNVLAAPLIVILALSTSTFAQDRHAIAPAQIADTVAQHVTSLDADRATIREALSRPDVRAVAARVGIDAEFLSASIGRFSSEEMARAADAARDANEALVGGASTITISTTTIILVLLVVILILVAD